MMRVTSCYENKAIGLTGTGGVVTAGPIISIDFTAWKNSLALSFVSGRDFSRADKLFLFCHHERTDGVPQAPLLRFAGCL